jgi:hypothetical protein
MKNKIAFTLLLIPILILSACGSKTGNPASTAQGNANAQELPLSTKLAIGTLKLEGTTSAITPTQAKDLLPLWQVYSSLITSDTAAQEEKDALAQQIQETMTADQIKAIDAMNLTQREVFTSMQALGIAPQFGGSNNGTTQQNGNTTRGNGQGQGGNFPPGGFPGGGPGGFGGNGTQLNPEQIATAQARRAANGNGGGFNNNRLLTPLIGAVIKLLESK